MLDVLKKMKWADFPEYEAPSSMIVDTKIYVRLLFSNLLINSRQRNQVS